MRKSNKPNKSIFTKRSKRLSASERLSQYEKLEPRNLLASLPCLDAYSPNPIADPFAQDAVTYQEMVSRAEVMPYLPGELVVAIFSPLQGNAFENYLQSINWTQFVGPEILPTNVIDSSETMMTLERDSGTVALVQLHFGDNTEVFAVMEHLQDNKSVLWSSPNFYQTEDPREYTPNDPQYSSQYHHTLVGNDLAWDTTLGDSNIIIGITDDGVELAHEDLAANIFCERWRDGGRRNRQRQQRLHRRCERMGLHQ